MFWLMLATTTQALNLISLIYFHNLRSEILKTTLRVVGDGTGRESQIDINVSDVQKPLETIKMWQGSDDHDVMWCHLEILVSNL